VRLKEDYPGHFNLRFRWHPGATRVILEAREPPWKTYLPTVLYHLSMINYLLEIRRQK
jgi:hypothetical protein